MSYDPSIKWVTTYKAAEMLGISEGTVRNRMRKGIVRGTRNRKTGMFLIPEEDLPKIKPMPRGRPRIRNGSLPTSAVFVHLDDAAAQKARRGLALAQDFYEFCRGAEYGKTALYRQIPQLRLAGNKYSDLPASTMKAVLDLAKSDTREAGLDFLPVGDKHGYSLDPRNPCRACVEKVGWIEADHEGSSLEGLVGLRYGPSGWVALL